MSQRRIARELRVNRETVARYAAAADPKPAIPTAGSCAGEPPDLTAGPAGPDPKPAISTAGVFGRKSLCDAVAEVINEKLDLGLTAQRIYQDLVQEQAFAGSYESVKRFVRRINRNVPLPFRRMECSQARSLSEHASGSGTRSVNALSTRFTGGFGKNRDDPGIGRGSRICAVCRKMGYSPEKTDTSRFRPCRNGVQEVESSDPFAIADQQA